MASVAGPLLGGSSSISGYVNLPIGLAALAVISVALPAGKGAGHAVIDYLGVGLLASGLSAIVLVTSLGGAAGTALFGSIFASGIADRQAGGRLSGEQLAALPEAARAAYAQGFVDALTPMFAVAAGIALVEGHDVEGRREVDDLLARLARELVGERP